MKRAILFAAGNPETAFPLAHFLPTSLFCVVDKPVIFHIIEFLASQDIRKLDIFLHHLPQKVERELGSGERFGVSITTHLLRDPAYPFAHLLSVASTWKDSPLLLGQGDCLPFLSTRFFQKEPFSRPRFWMSTSNAWLGWAVVPLDHLMAIPINLQRDQLPLFFKESAEFYASDLEISAKSASELKESNLRMMNAPPFALMFPSTSKETAARTWLSRGVYLHPQAEVLSPVFIGEGCQIHAGAKIGPQVVIESQCVIDARTKITNAHVLQRSYVGEDLEIKNSTVSRELLLNHTLNTSVCIQDSFILGSLHIPSSFNFFALLSEKGCALFLFLLSLPLFVLMLASHRLKKESFIQIPSKLDPERWRSFERFSFAPKAAPNCLTRPFKYLPSLFNIIKGEFHFVGLPLKTLFQVAELPEDLQKSYLFGKAGLITPADLCCNAAEIEVNWAAETYYAVHMSVWNDIKMIFKWMFQRCAGNN